LDTEPELESLDDFDIADILDDPAWPFTLPNHQLNLGERFVELTHRHDLDPGLHFHRYRSPPFHPYYGYSPYRPLVR